MVAVPVQGLDPTHLRDVAATLDDLVRRPRNRPAGRPAHRRRGMAALGSRLRAGPASVAAHYDAVATIYRLAHDEDPIDYNPCARIPPPNVHRELQRREVLTVLQYAGYLTVARSLGPAHHAIAVQGGMMGLRASEMTALTVESLTSVRGYVTLTFSGKGDKPAHVPVPLPALPAIQDAVAGRSSGPLLRTRTGAGMDRRSVHRYVAHTARVAGITRPIGPHALRRTVATVGLNRRATPEA
jgi:integrase/recombinase XerD